MAMRSELSYRFVGVIAAVFILSSIFSAPFSLRFGGDGAFAITEGLLLAAALGAFLYHYSKKESLIITKDRLLVCRLLSGKERSWKLSDISDFEWGHKNVATVGARIGRFYTPGEASSEQVMIIHLKDGTALRYSNYDFVNLADLRTHLFNYCHRHGIIKYDPFALRKEREEKRRRRLHRKP
jgi:hypothetical protein